MAERRFAKQQKTLDEAKLKETELEDEIDRLFASRSRRLGSQLSDIDKKYQETVRPLSVRVSAEDISEDRYLTY